MDVGDTHLPDSTVPCHGPLLQLFGLVMTLLDALRTSFSQRSFEARSMGTTDPLADAAVAATTMFKVSCSPRQN